MRAAVSVAGWPPASDGASLKVRTGTVGCASRGSGTALTLCGTGALGRTTGTGDDTRATSCARGGLMRAACAAMAGVPRVGIATEPPTEFIIGPSDAGMAGIVARSGLASTGGRSMRTTSL